MNDEELLRCMRPAQLRAECLRLKARNRKLVERIERARAHVQLRGPRWDEFLESELDAAIEENDDGEVS